MNFICFLCVSSLYYVTPEHQETDCVWEKNKAGSIAERLLSERSAF